MSNIYCNWYWNVLNIPPTSDLREIRRAYATQLRKTRPDEDPEGFQQLRSAYEAAIEEAAKPQFTSESYPFKRKVPKTADPADGKKPLKINRPEFEIWKSFTEDRKTYSDEEAVSRLLARVEEQSLWFNADSMRQLNIFLVQHINADASFSEAAILRLSTFLEWRTSLRFLSFPQLRQTILAFHERLQHLHRSDYRQRFHQHWHTYLTDLDPSPKASKYRVFQAAVSQIQLDCPELLFYINRFLYTAMIDGSFPSGERKTAYLAFDLKQRFLELESENMEIEWETLEALLNEDEHHEPEPAEPAETKNYFLKIQIIDALIPLIFLVCLIGGSYQRHLSRQRMDRTNIFSDYLVAGSALHYYVADDNLHMVRRLLDQGWDVNAYRPELPTPLSIAVNGNQIAMTEKLIWARADPQPDPSQPHAAEIARAAGHERLAKTIEKVEAVLAKYDHRPISRSEDHQ